MKGNENLLLIVDMQNDFCKTDGALYIPGAEKDVKRLVEFIRKKGDDIDHIILTKDAHLVMDISHPKFWRDSQGTNPIPYTQISYDDVDTKRWIPLKAPDQVKWYIKQLEKQGEFPHVIWPEHCIIGANGVEIVEEITEAVDLWTKSGKSYEVITKGDHQLAEHFGILRANVPLDSAPETQVNQRLLETLKSYNKIYVAGEARSHCVANSLRQVLEIEDIGSSFILLEDCMSNVPGFEKLAEPIYIDALSKGVTFAKSNSISW